MRRSLALKLTLAFLLVSITGAALAAVLARWATSKEFDRLVSNQAQSDFVTAVSFYYQVNESWRGVGEYLRQTLLLRQPLPAADANPPRPPPFALVDQNGRVVIPAGKYLHGDVVPAADLDRGIPVEFDGQVVGVVLTTGLSPPLDPVEERYVARTNQALFYAALGAMLVALFLGVVLARRLARPLRELTHATHAMARGELGQQVNVHSQDELGELAAAFNQMSADLARANQLRRQMTADIAHDLRTPLTVITGYLESLRDGVLQPSPARFEAMHNEALHLQRLVEDLRTLSLADAGELRLNRQPVELLGLLERVVAAYQYQAEQQNITLHVRAGASLPALDADPERMMQVLGNLVSNALRYTSPGGHIELCAEQQGGSVPFDPPAQQAGRRWEAHGVLLSVQDDGAGIEPEALPYIFERFYRADSARQQNDDESGLGLAIARSIVVAHGGEIWAQSALGEGSKFNLLLPAIACA